MKATLSIIAAAVALSGCAIGSSDFSCRGYPTGHSCMSALEVYDASNSDAPVLGMHDHKDEKGDKSDAPAPRTVQFGGIVPPPDRPVPVRADPKILRVWFMPWVDPKGNLNAGGYMYAEVEPRKWNIGAVPTEGTRVLYPVTAAEYQAAGDDSSRDDTIKAPAATISGSTPAARGDDSTKNPVARFLANSKGKP